MSFWSAERLRVELPALISDFDANRVDCASYHLSVGPEVYISPSDDTRTWQSRRKIALDKIGADFVIPPGQFAFLLTEEYVRVPDNALALISMRSKPKFKGLVNVSGFHVDPGYHGRLVYSVFNAGPSPIHVARGDPWFLIFYADLDRHTKETRTQEGYSQIPSELINDVAGDVQSFEVLRTTIDSVERKLGDRVAVVERDHALIRWATALIIGAFVTILLKDCSSFQKNQIPNAPTSHSAPLAVPHQPTPGQR